LSDLSRKNDLEKQIVEQSPTAFEGLSRTKKDKLLNYFLNSQPKPQVQRQGKVQSQRTTQQTFYQGALPHPDLMQGFKSVYPELPHEITKMAIDAEKHMMSREDNIISNVFRLKEKGQLFAFIISMTSIVGGIILLAIDKNVAGYIAGSTGLVLITAMFLGTRVKGLSKDTEEEEIE